MDSGSNHSQNTPVRAEYERQIAPIIAFIWVQPGSRLVEQVNGQASDTADSKQASASDDKHSIRTWDIIICQKCLCFLICKVAGDKRLNTVILSHFKE